MSDQYKTRHIEYPPPPKPVLLPGDIEVSVNGGSTELFVFFCATEEQTKAGEITERHHGEWRRLGPKEERGLSMESDLALKIRLDDMACVSVTSADYTHQLYNQATLAAHIMRGGEHNYPFIIEIDPPQLPIQNISEPSAALQDFKHFYFHSLKTTVDARTAKLEFEWKPNPYAAKLAERVSA